MSTGGRHHTTHGPARTAAGRAGVQRRFSVPRVRELPAPPRMDDAGLW
jgi:hypothetical protein